MTDVITKGHGTLICSIPGCDLFPWSALYGVFYCTRHDPNNSTGEKEDTTQVCAHCGFVDERSIKTNCIVCCQDYA